MCAIIGAVLKNPSEEDLTLLERVFHESSIRGLHATGVSYIKNKKIVTQIAPVAAAKFVRMFELGRMINEDGNLYLIGHCRYSTSDLEYNQPLFNDNTSIVHNGVISQELPENWEELYGYQTKTKNDSELLLKTVEQEENPLLKWKNASIAAIELHLDSKKIVYYRNGKRPIYESNLDNGLIVTSTHDIMHRSSRGKIFALEVPKD